jgi:nucleoid DNA-binding protein
MNTEIVRILREHGLKKDQAKQAAEDIGEFITRTLAEGLPVRLDGIGVLEAKPTPHRVGRNPQTGETVDIPAGHRIAFRMSKILKDRLAAAKPTKPKSGGRTSARQGSAAHVP